MSIATPTALAATRAFVIALAAVCPAIAALPWLRALSPLALRSTFAATALVFFTPAMLAGYGWLPTITRWPANSAAREIFYCTMLWLRLMPLASLALWFAKPGPDATAAHCARMAGCANLRWRLRELGAAPWLAAGIVFLLAFQEFDLATSWGIRSWTVALFDAQTGGLALRESLRLALPALCIELAVIAPLLLALGSLRTLKMEREIPASSGCLPVLVQCVVAPALFIAVPAWHLAALALGGFGAWIENASLAREMANSLALAGVCALLAWLLSAFVQRRTALVLAVPGLLGPLLLSLLILAAAQPFDAISRTAFPLGIALVLQLLPLAMLPRPLIRPGGDPAPLLAARNSGAHAAAWPLSRGPAFGAVLLLFGVAYGDFTMSVLLAPPQFTTVFARIFNLMHYGQNAVLSASVFIAVVTPLLCLWLTRRLLRLYVARRVR